MSQSENFLYQKKKHSRKCNELICFSISGVQAAAFSYVSEFHTKATGSRAASFVAMFLSAIFLFIPVVAIILIPMDWSFYIYTLKFTPWRLYIIICGSLNIIVFVIFNFLPESPSFLLQINEKEKALEILQAMYAFNTGNSKEVNFCVHTKDAVPFRKKNLINTYFDGRCFL